MYNKKDVEKLENEWNKNARWKGVTRPYSGEDVIKLQGSHVFDYPVARSGAHKLWSLFESESFVRALGALTGNQAVQMVQAGLKAIYLSGWQVAADSNDAAETYPDQSLYPWLSGPNLTKRINNALLRADKIEHLENQSSTDWFVPIIADAEAGFGGPLNTFELIKAYIEAGVSAIHLEDQISSLKKCGHMGGKVLEPTHIFIEKLVAARLATDVLNVPTLLIARTDAHAASMIRFDYSELDHPFLTGERSPEGYYFLNGGVDYAIARGVAFAPYADVIWCETSTPDIEEAKRFAAGIHAKFPGKWLAYNCSPSFNWKKHLSDSEIATFQEELAKMGYKFQFVTLAGFHSLNAGMFELAKSYSAEGMAAYSKFQEHEFNLEESGFKAIKHQRFVGAGYYDAIQLALSDGHSSTTALKGSTEEEQFH